MDTSEEEGKEKGIVIGIEIGIPQGETIKARKIAKELKDESEPIERIIKYTKLTIE